MNLHRSFCQLLGDIGPDSRISASPYDTAWLARLGDMDRTLSDGALAWLREHQLPDGSWGAPQPRYHHERLICTLAAMIALARQSCAGDRTRWQRAQSALEAATRGLLDDPAGATIGFEMIVPTLLAEAEALGVIRGPVDGILGKLGRYRAAKLAALPDGLVNRFFTVAFSSEMVGLDGLKLLDVENLQEANGSVAYSPAATTFFTLHVRPEDAAALNYLRRVAADGSAPYIAPIEVFERGWALWNLAQAGPLDDDLLALAQPHLDFLQAYWQPGEGISACAGLTLIDGDTTGIVYDVLTRFGRAVDLEGVLHYETDDHFLCFPIEANPSISTNIHVLGALRQAGLGVEHPTVHKVLDFLRRAQTMRMFWFDKWNASPYYSTAHAIMVCVGYADALVQDAVYWMAETQNPDGSWGYYMPTAEETAYCLQALVAWKRQGHEVSAEALKRGAAWLAEHAEPPYPPLWIGKSLYCPEVVARSAILSALILVAQE